MLLILPLTGVFGKTFIKIVTYAIFTAKCFLKALKGCEVTLYLMFQYFFLFEIWVLILFSCHFNVLKKLKNLPQIVEMKSWFFPHFLSISSASMTIV